MNVKPEPLHRPTARVAPRPIPCSSAPIDATRRTFLQRSLATGAFVGAASSGWLALLNVPNVAYAAAYEEIDVMDGGSITGRITFSGTVPTNMIVPEDREICGAPRREPQILVGSDGGVQDAVVYIAEIAKGKAWPQVETPRLDNVDCVFLPAMLAMPPGPIIIVNSDPLLHNTHIYYGRRTALNLALPKQGMEIERELERPGILRIECDEHGHMHAAGYVAANPYYSTTNESGEYQITDVPPGDYNLVIYQRTTGPKEQMVTVEAGTAATIDVDLA